MHFRILRCPKSTKSKIIWTIFTTLPNDVEITTKANPGIGHNDLKKPREPKTLSIFRRKMANVFRFIILDLRKYDFLIWGFLKTSRSSVYRIPYTTRFDGIGSKSVQKIGSFVKGSVLIVFGSNHKFTVPLSPNKSPSLPDRERIQKNQVWFLLLQNRDNFDPVI